MWKVLTREEWQEYPPSPIDSVMEAEQDLRDRDDLINLMGKIIYYQAQVRKNHLSYDYDELRKLMQQLPDDWTETLEV